MMPLARVLSVVPVVCALSACVEQDDAAGVESRLDQEGGAEDAGARSQTADGQADANSEVQLPEYCLSECDTWTGQCPRADVESLTVTRERWSDMSRCGTAEPDAFQGSYAGRCADGVEFLVVENNGFEARFFQPNGAFVALLAVTDDLEVGCPAYFWPEPYSCEGGVVTEVYCGDAFQPGDVRPFPL